MTTFTQGQYIADGRDVVSVDKGLTVARCAIGYSRDGEISAEEAEANARFLASTSELLTACLNMQGLYDTPVERRRKANDALYAEAIQHLRATIAQATKGA